MKQPEYVQIGLNDRFCQTIAKMFGPAALGRWIMLKAELSRSPTLSLDINHPLDHEYLMSVIMATDHEMRELIEYAVKCGQLDLRLYHDGILWSQPLVDELQQFYRANKRNLPQKPSSHGKIPDMGLFSGKIPEQGGMYGKNSGDEGDVQENFQTSGAKQEESHIDRIIDREIDRRVRAHVPADARDESNLIDEFKENRLKNFQSPSGGGNGDDVEQYLIEEKELQAFALEFITAYGKNGTVDKVVQGIRDAAKEALARKPNQDMGKFCKALLRKARESREKDQLDDISDRYRLKPEKWLEGRNYLLEYKPKTSTGNNGTGTENGTPQWKIPRD